MPALAVCVRTKNKLPECPGGYMIRKLAFASLLSLASAPLWAAECSVTVDSTDQMSFDTKAIEISKS